MEPIKNGTIHILSHPVSFNHNGWSLSVFILIGGGVSKRGCPERGYVRSFIVIFSVVVTVNLSGLTRFCLSLPGSLIISLSASLLLRKAFPIQHLFTPKLLIVEEISIPLAKVLNLS